MPRLHNVILVVLSTALIFLGTDFILTAVGLDPFTLQKKTRNVNPGRHHDIYHHDFKPNLDEDIWFGTIKYHLCTNEYGFKISCSKKDEPVSKHYDMAFIGDSFTEAIGLPYDESFVGIFEANNPSLNVVNLGVQSYSPIIYYIKIAHLLSQGFTFKHIIVGIDISDIYDEAMRYVLSSDETKVLDKNIKSTPRPPHPFDKKISERNNIFEKYFKYTWYINIMVYEFLYSTKIDSIRFNRFPEISYWAHTDESPLYDTKLFENGVKQAVDNMTKLKKLLDVNNIKMSVLVYPWPDQLMHATRNHRGVTLWKEFCERENCANFIDVNPILFDRVEETSVIDTLNENYILDDIHFNTRGNALVYEVIQENFINK